MNILFVCTGNICRSPFAEYYARQRATELGLHSLQFRSAGIMGVDGNPCSDVTRHAARALSVNVEEHLAQTVSDDLLEWAELILVMEEEQARSVRDLTPSLSRGKIQLLSSYCPGYNKPLAIPDPHRAAEWAHRASFELIRQCVDEFFVQLTRQSA
ncbi:MAG: low molecular weight protein-tyrosine-phosphatase [Myxococcota bacterium]